MFLREVAGGCRLLAGLILSFSRYNCCYPSIGAPSCNKSDNCTAGRTCPISSKFPIAEFHSLHCHVSDDMRKNEALNFSNSFTAGFWWKRPLEVSCPSPGSPQSSHQREARLLIALCSQVWNIPGSYNLPCHILQPGAAQGSTWDFGSGLQSLRVQIPAQETGRDVTLCSLFLVGTQAVTWPTPEINERSTGRTGGITEQFRTGSLRIRTFCRKGGLSWKLDKEKSGPAGPSKEGNTRTKGGKSEM